MKKIILLLTIMCLTLCSSIDAQVTMGSSQPPVAGALLDLKEDGTTKRGLLLPRVALSDLDNLFPMFTSGAADYSGTNKDKEDTAHTGMMVYNTATVANSIFPGIYTWNGVKWQAMIEPIMIKILRAGNEVIAPISLNPIPYTQAQMDLSVEADGAYKINAADVADVDNMLVAPLAMTGSKGTTPIAIALTENTLNQARSMSFIVRADDGKMAKQVTINQAKPVVTVDQPNVNFAAAGGAFTFQVVSNINYTLEEVTGVVTGLPTVNQTPTNGRSYTANIATNGVAAERVMTIHVKSASGVVMATIRISQAAASILIAPVTDNYFPRAGGTKQFQVVSNVPWTLVSHIDDHSIINSYSQTSGNVGTTIVSVTLNPSPYADAEAAAAIGFKASLPTAPVITQQLVVAQYALLKIVKHPTAFQPMSQTTIHPSGSGTHSMPVTAHLAHWAGWISDVNMDINVYHDSNISGYTPVTSAIPVQIEQLNRKRTVRVTSLANAPLDGAPSAANNGSFIVYGMNQSMTVYFRINQGSWLSNVVYGLDASKDSYYNAMMMHPTGDAWFDTSVSSWTPNILCPGTRPTGRNWESPGIEKWQLIRQEIINNHGGNFAYFGIENAWYFAPSGIMQGRYNPVTGEYQPGNGGITHLRLRCFLNYFN